MQHYSVSFSKGYRQYVRAVTGHLYSILMQPAFWYFSLRIVLMYGISLLPLDITISILIVTYLHLLWIIVLQILHSKILYMIAPSRSKRFSISLSLMAFLLSLSPSIILWKFMANQSIYLDFFRRIYKRWEFLFITPDGRISKTSILK